MLCIYVYMYVDIYAFMHGVQVVEILHYITNTREQ